MFHRKRKQVIPHEVANLENAHMHLGPASHHGIPRTSCRLAFDPIQKLLAIGTLDGKIKLLGNNDIEGILVSESRSRCKYLEFANNMGFLVDVTADNKIQIWDLERKEVADSLKWHAHVTALAIIQGSPFMYVGEDSGNVAVLRYDKEKRKLSQMPYNIPMKLVFGEIRTDPFASVIGILPFPEVFHSRVLIAYSNAVIVVWNVVDSKVEAVRKVSGRQMDQTPELTHDDDDLDDGIDEKDVCAMCWADSSGEVLAIGYTDGDIWIWGLGKSSSHPDLPLIKFQLSSDDARSPVLALCWCATGEREAAIVGGHLFVYGGGSLGCSESFTVCSLKTASSKMKVEIVQHVDIPLEGLFEDMILLPRAGDTLLGQASALLVLTSHGQLHAYDEANIAEFLKINKHINEPNIPDPVPINPFTRNSNITVVKMAEIPEDGETAAILSELSRGLSGSVASVLLSGTKWPITGGSLTDSAGRESKVNSILITGHEDGSVNVWDASSSVLSRFCNLPATITPKLEQASAGSAVSHLDFCSSRGILVMAQGSRRVIVYKVSTKPDEATCKLYQSSLEIQDLKIDHSSIFKCVAVLDNCVTVTCLSISNQGDQIAVAHDDDMVLLLDIDHYTHMSHKCKFPDGEHHIQSLTFGVEINNSVILTSSSMAAKLLKGVIYATKEFSFSALLYSNEYLFPSGPWKNDGTRIVCIHSLEIFNDRESERASLLIDQGLQRSVNVKRSQPSKTFLHFLIVCTQVSAFLYSCNFSNETIDPTCLKKVHFQSPCSSASVFYNQNQAAHKLAVLTSAATLEIRSIPSLEIIEQFPMTGIYNLDPNVSENPTFLCGNKGLMALVDAKREIVIFSVLSDDDDDGPRGQDKAISFYNKDLVANFGSASKPGPHQQTQKKQIRNVVGGALKDLKVGILKEIKGGSLKSPKGGEEDSLGERVDILSNVFMSPLSPESSLSSQMNKSGHGEIKIATSELDIDDIEIEDDEIIHIGDNGEVTPSSRGKGRVSASADDRKKLLGSDEHHHKPVRRTADEIRAKYGHKPLGDASGPAAQARDKLLERHEKLQVLGKRTEEMQEGAQNFASLAAELAKTMEERKWWQL
ncbi:hypothetical protein KP509_04G073600 [Ceratopteris richardii]|uniref:V-SNARE coiled-coil homology domain-containing protein n=1 Tax=Ceratopteris richardii TaxID=49495 RepID=A0A8T2V1S0_CERRI|nr:hypothetical protein KP509_04G073600 [Ceratopteris richardii]